MREYYCQKERKWYRLSDAFAPFRLTDKETAYIETLLKNRQAMALRGMEVDLDAPINLTEVRELLKNPQKASV